MIQKARTLAIFLLFTTLWGCDPGSTPSEGGSGGSAVEAVDGFIEGTLDGEERKWHITSGEMNGTYVSQSSWENFAGMTEITLFGHSRPDTLIASQEALMIVITTSGAEPSADVSDAEVVYLSGGVSQGYSSNEKGGFKRLVISSIQQEGDTLRLSGHFEARMAFRALGAADDVPEQEMLTLKGGRFEATVRKGD